MLGVTQSEFVAVGSDVRGGAIGAVGDEPLPEHAVATASDRAAHAVRARREETEEKRFENVTEAAPFTSGSGWGEHPGSRLPYVARRIASMGVHPTFWAAAFARTTRHDVCVANS